MENAMMVSSIVLLIACIALITAVGCACWLQFGYPAPLKAFVGTVVGAVAGFAALIVALVMPLLHI
jgi:hypothetical protein